MRCGTGPYDGMNPMCVALGVLEEECPLRPPLSPTWHPLVLSLLEDCWHADPRAAP